MRARLFAVSLAASAVWGQSQTPAAQPEVLKESTYVRRISVGATLSVLPLVSVPTGDASVVTTTPPVDSIFSTKDNSRRIGFGLTAQLAVTERFAVSASALVRKIGYKKNTDTITGVDNPLTVADERTHTILNEDTRARYLDFPITIRYYTKDRHVSGVRGFVEGGFALRRVSQVRTATDSTVNTGATVCCSNTPARLDRSSVHGLVGGAGIQFVDDIGIRVVPEVRYTRWAGQPFNTPSTNTQRNQIEAVISLTF